LNCPKVNEVSIEVCHECSLNCIMCSSSAAYPEPVPNRLTLQEIKTILHDAKQIGAKYFSISGGEPLQRKDFNNILAYSLLYGYRVLLYTTGIIRNSDELRTVDDLFLRKLSLINTVAIFDIQSHDPRTHDHIMQVPGSHDMSVDVIKRAIKMDIDVETHFVPQKDNWKQIEDYVYWLDELGVKKTSFLRLVPQGRAAENDVMITKQQFKRIQEVFYELLNNRNDLKIKIRLGHPIDFQFLIDDKKPVNACRGGNDAPLITPWGSVHTCPAWKQLEHYSAGNVRHQSLKDIWENSPMYRTFRWFIHEKGYLNMDKDSKCHNCEFFHGCKGKCVAQRLIAYSDGRPLEEAILLGTDPMCWHEP